MSFPNPTASENSEIAKNNLNTAAVNSLENTAPDDASTGETKLSAGRLIQESIQAHLNHQKEMSPETDSGASATPGNKNRYQKRIDELTHHAESSQRQLEQLQTFIAAHPELLNAYYQMQRQGAAQMPPSNPEKSSAATPENSQTHIQLTQPGTDEIDRLPSWDPNNMDTVRAHAQVMMRQELSKTLNQVLAPVMSKLSSLDQMAGSLRQDSKRQRLQQLNDVLYTEIPSARENAYHERIAQSYITDALSQLSSVQRDDLELLETTIRRGILNAKKGLQGQPFETAVKPMAPSPAIRTEGGQNMVQPRSVNPKSKAEMILAHLQQGKR